MGAFGRGIKNMVKELSPPKKKMSNGQIQQAIGKGQYGVKLGDKQAMTVMQKMAEAELNSQNPNTKKK